jgi:hypothetical protein
MRRKIVIMLINLGLGLFTVSMFLRHYKIFCVNGKYGIQV